MKTRSILFAIAALALIASAGMFIVGSGSSHMSELKDFFWTPLPLALILFIAGLKTK